MNDCFKGAIAFAAVFAYGKYNEIDYFKGRAFYGLYFYGQKIKSLSDDHSKKNILIRRLHFCTLIMMDFLVVVFVIKYSWLFN
jgi:hypothetical protein